MKTGDHISVELETVEAPFRQLGLFRSEDDEYIRLEGTVGNDIGKEILVPKHRVKRIVV